MCLCQPGFEREPLDECKKPMRLTARQGSVVLHGSGDKVRLNKLGDSPGRYTGDVLGNGPEFGEYEVEGSYDGRTLYRQRDTLRSQRNTTQFYLAFDGEGPRLFGQCLGKCGKWYVANEVGPNTDRYLQNLQDTPKPPTLRWEVIRRGNWTREDSITLREGILKPCRVVMLHGHGETSRNWGSSSSAYTPTADWSFGRPVYRKATPPERFLMVDGDKHPGGHLGVWVVKSSTAAGLGWYMASFNAPNNPTALDEDEWQYWEGSVEDGKWMNANVTVQCPFEVAPLTPPSSWPNSVVLSLDSELSGEYQLEEVYNGRPVFTQRDRVRIQTFFLFFYENGEQHGWYVGPILGRPSGWLYNPSNSVNVPEMNWKGSNGTMFIDLEPSPTFREGNLEPCKEVRVAAIKGKGPKNLRSAGTYEPTDIWSNGRPVYQQVESPYLYLLVAKDRTTWSTRTSPNSPLAWMDSDRTTNSPGDPAGIPDLGGWLHSGDTELRDNTSSLEERKVVGWKDGGTTVTCVCDHHCS